MAINESTARLTDSEAGDSNGATTVLDNERRLMCLEAVWEIDALARLLPTAVPDALAEGGHFAVRGIAGRLLRLTSAMMSALDDDSVSTAEITKIVTLTGTYQG